MSNTDVKFRRTRRVAVALVLATITSTTFMVGTQTSASAGHCLHPADFWVDEAFDNDLVRLNGGYADFGDCGHWDGRPTGHGVVSWIPGESTRSGQIMAVLRGRVYLDPSVFQGGCARVRVRFYNSSGRIMQSHYSTPLCGGPLFNKSGRFTTELESNSIRSVRVCTQYALSENWTWSTTACRRVFRGD